MTTTEPVRVLFCCTGIGIFNRGIESFFREAFTGLKGMAGIDTKLIKGAGDQTGDEWVATTLPRTGRIAQTAGRLARRNGYVVEQWSSFFPVVRRIRKYRPHVVFYSDSNLGFLLYRFRRQINVPFRLLFSNGGPCKPPFDRTDFVHQVAPLYLDEALSHGEPPEKHFLVPYGVSTPEAPASKAEAKAAIRQRLGIPNDRAVILTVGWIARTHKRMHYVIEEVAAMSRPRPFLQLLGAIDTESEEIIEMANRLLGPSNFAVNSVPLEQVRDYYRAADMFVLASLKEGFGRVYLEALMNGLPVVAHDHPVARYVLGGVGRLADLSVPGTLTRLLHETLASLPEAPGLPLSRWRFVRDRFDWNTLKNDYRKMFIACANAAPATSN